MALGKGTGVNGVTNITGELGMEGRRRRLDGADLVWRALVLSSALVLFGCAVQDRGPPDAYNATEASRVFEAGYQDVLDIYIEDLEVSTLAAAGVDGLSSIDPALSIDRNAGEFVVKVGDTDAGHFGSTSPASLGYWADVTATAITAARRSSADIGVAHSEDIYEAVFSGMLEELDDFSRYAGRDQARENRASRDGFGGIGVRIRVIDEGVKVLAVMEETPAEKAGLEDGDLITHINEEPAAGLSQIEVVRRLRGPSRSKVRVTVTREAAPEPLVIAITRSHIVPQTVRYEAEGGIGYLQISGFNQNTTQSIRERVVMAKRALGPKLKGLVLDLRDNPGGLLDQAVSVSDLFIPQGRIVSTHGRHPDSHQFFDADSEDLASGLPIAVLINGNSASASEIVAAALQDSGRAVVIGSNSFGKGTVQNVLRLPNDGELTLTWARFHAPSGYTIQARGVMPDICTSAFESGAADLLEQVRRGDHLVDRLARTRTFRAEDEAAISALRESCPLNEGESKIDLQVARSLIEDQGLYARIRRSSEVTAENVFN